MLVALLVMATSILPVTAQDRDRRDDRDSHHNDSYNNQRFYQGVRNGGRGGQYYDPRYENRQNENRYHSGYNNNGAYSDRYNNRQYNNGYYSNQGGIGPGKGALIGGASGAALGLVFGRSLKGTIVGGAAGAGIGAVVGEVHQKNQQNQYYPR